MAVWNRGFVSPGLCSGMSLPASIKMMHGPINIRFNIIKFTRNNGIFQSLSFEYASKVLTEVSKFSFLGSCIDYQLNWKSHTEKIIPKLSSVCCSLRKHFFFVGIEVLCMVYFANFQSMVVYGIIFWGNSTSPSHIFLLQKKIIGIMVGVSPRCLGRGFFHKLDILNFQCLCIFSLMLFVLKDLNNFHTNSYVHENNTRYKNQLHRPVANLSSYQRIILFWDKDT